ncbi:MAG: phosphatase domain-containing protein [Thermoanaerobaculia bacterium]|nr:phosphatase domain-containing protein [Thermoanaerobaculia bacterium]
MHTTFTDMDGGALERLGRGFREALRILNRPVRMSGPGGGITLRPFRGYGTEEEVFLMGRVVRQLGAPSGFPPGSIRRDLLDCVRRVLRRGVSGGELEATVAGTRGATSMDRDGYFRLRLPLEDPLPRSRLWHSVELAWVRRGRQRARADAPVFVPPTSARFVVISDIDDTVVHTGVENKIEMMWNLFAQGAESRVAFPGVAPLYQALHGGRSGDERNPMLYVSRGPWSLYDVLDEFFQLHGIPVGPILFLRNWGFTPRSPLPRKSEGHKRDLIREMLELYDELPFVLIGDSGQHDPETYAEVVREHPGRVEAIYIRNVNDDPERHDAIEKLALEIAEAGSRLLLASDSLAMARDATENGLIPEGVLDEVAEVRTDEVEEPALHPTREVDAGDEDDVREAIAEGELEEELEPPEDAETPPNVTVDAEGDEVST